MAKTMKLFWTTLVFVGALFTTAIGKELIVPPIHTITEDDAVIDSAFQKAEADKWWPIIKAANIKGQ